MGTPFRTDVKPPPEAMLVDDWRDMNGVNDQYYARQGCCNSSADPGIALMGVADVGQQSALQFQKVADGPRIRHGVDPTDKRRRGERMDLA